MPFVITGYEYTTPKKVFKTSFLFCGAIGIWAFLGALFVSYKDANLTKRKWIGSLLGMIAHYTTLALVYLFGGNVLGLLPVAILIFVSYIVFLIVFGVRYDTSRYQQPLKPSVASVMQSTARPFNEKGGNVSSPLATEETSIASKRLQQVTETITFAARFLQKFTIGDKFPTVQDKVVDSLVSFLLVYELIFKDSLYDADNEYAKELLNGEKMHAVTIGLYEILQLSEDFPSIRPGDVYGKIEEILSENIRQNNESMYSMSLSELKLYMVESIKVKLEEGEEEEEEEDAKRQQ